MIELNTIYNEDCLKTMKRMPDGFVDLTVTSPPYDDLRKYNGYSFDFEPKARELYRITKYGGVVVWVVGDQVIKASESGTSFRQALYFKEIGFNLHDTMIYQKAGSQMPDLNRYLQQFEYMFVLSKGSPKTYNLIKDRKNVWSGKAVSHYRDENGRLKYDKKYISREMGIRFNVWQYSHGSNINAAPHLKHPATFPIKLAKDHIVSWSNKGDTVYDPFMGSGTTAKAAKDLGRNYIGSEISKEYCEIAEERLKQETLL